VRADEVKLAGLTTPAGVDPEVRDAIRESVGEAFVFGFRVIMAICATLAVASSAVSWRMVPRGALESGKY
jgi:hypothetical protein